MTLETENQTADQSGYVHPDDLELQRLEQEAAAEQAPPKTEEDGQPAQPEQPDPTPPAPETPKEPDQIAIPKQRLDEVLSELRAARERENEKDRQLAYLAGQVEARKTATPDAAPQTPQQDPVADHEAKIDTLYERYDAGEIGMAELKREERTLLRERDAIVAERSKPSPEQVAQTIASDPYLQEKTAELESQNAWLNNVPPVVVQHSLLPLAYQMLADKGIAIGNDVRSTLALRFAVVQAGKVLGLDQRGQGQSLPVDKTPAQPTADQRRQKVELARNHPPAMQTAGTGAASGQTYSPEDIDKMSDVDLASLPASILEQLAPSR